MKTVLVLVVIGLFGVACSGGLTESEVVSLIQEHSVEGLVGPQGPVGIQGTQGVQGPQGVQGGQGIRGDVGVQGKVGPMGNQGPLGAKGERGERGVVGPKGDTGTVGPPGSGLEISLAEFVRQDLDVNKVQESLDITSYGVVHVQAVLKVESGVMSGKKGTGFVFHIEDGWAYVLTAAHIVDDDPIEFRIFRGANRKYEAEMVYRSDSRSIDITSLKFKCDDCKALDISNKTLLSHACSNDSCYKVLPGQDVVSVSWGDLDKGVEIMSGATAENCCFDELPAKVYHDTYLIKGDSGSPLLNLDGYVVGINFGVDDAGRSHALYLVDEDANRLVHNTLRRAREDRRR